MRSRIMRKIAPVLLIASFLVACQDSEPTRPSEAGPISFAIDDGAHGGNPEFFFFPPLVPNPKKDPNFGDNQLNTEIAPFVRICELDGTGPDPTCVADVGPDLPMTLDLRKEQWRVNWRTRRFPLDNDKYYRIQVMLGDWVVGYRDVDPVPGDSPGACKNEIFCKFDNGSAIPINVRIEVFAGCPDTRCQTKSFNLDEETNFEVEYSAGKRILLNIPDQDEDRDVTMSFGVCNEAQEQRVDDLIDLPTFGPCASTDILTDWTGELEDGKTATVSFCELDDLNFGLGTAQGAHLRVHAFHEDGTVEALRERELCNAGLGSLPTNPFLRFASRVRDRASSWIGVRPLMASAAAVGPGARGGNSLGTIRTEFVLALPGKIDYVSADDTTRTAPAGEDLLTTAVVTDLTGGGVEGARVRWKVVEPSEEDPYLVVGDVWSNSCTMEEDELVCETDGDGEVAVWWTLADDQGVNKLIAGGRGIADRREAFNGPRDFRYDPDGPFDPFTPIAWEEYDPDGIDEDADEGADTIVAGTRIVFTAAGALVGDLVSWWPGDEHARDIVGGNDGTLINYDAGDTRYALGIDDYAFAFDGEGRGTPGGGTGQEVAAPAAGMEALPELTVEAWVKHNTPIAGFIERYVTIGGSNGDGPIGVIRHDGDNTPGQFHYYMRVLGVQYEVRVNNVLQTDCFHHAVGTYDGTEMIAYLDGVEVGSQLVSATIARASSVTLSSADEPIDGLIDEVRIYDRAITPTEIQTLYDAGGEGKCLPLRIDRYDDLGSFTAALGGAATATQDFEGLDLGTPVSNIIPGILDVSSPFETLEVWAGSGADHILFGHDDETRVAGDGRYDLTFSTAGYNAIAFNIEVKDPATDPMHVIVNTTAGSISFTVQNYGSESDPVFLGFVSSSPVESVFVIEGPEESGTGNEETGLDDFVVAIVGSP
jgi:hypothetical protein